VAPYRIVGQEKIMTRRVDARGWVVGCVLMLSGLSASAAWAQSNLPPYWESRDIGTTGQSGSSSYDSQVEVWTVQAAGVNIWGTNDAFHFVYRPLNGDGVAIIRVDSLEDTHTFAKAGLMIRASLSPDAKHALVNVRPNATWEFLARVETGGLTTAVGGTGADVPRWLALIRRGNQVEAFVSFKTGVLWPGSPPTSAWTSMGSVSFAMPYTVYVGLAATSLDENTLGTSTFSDVSVASRGRVGDLPTPWTAHSIGDVGRPGGAAYSREGNVFSIAGAGSDIWGTADAFQLVSQPIQGDVEIVTLVERNDNTHPFAKAGLMLREQLTPDSAHVILDVRPNGQLEFMTRKATGETTTFIAGGSPSPPVFLKLTRAGSTVTGLVSRDGTSWSIVGSVTTTMADQAHVGMAVTSHDRTQLNTAVFSHVWVVGPSTDEIVLYPASTRASEWRGWVRGTDLASPHGTNLFTHDAGNSYLDAPVAFPANYIEMVFAASAGVPYTLWLRLRAAGNSKWNDSVWVQFSDALVNGASVYGLHTSRGLLVNLATDGTASSLNEWGWANGAYWLAQPATVTFRTSGLHRLRLQLREDGVAVDQIVLSSGRYLHTRPGAVTNDHTIVSTE
jgi:regulation of enolase protein 1 (concanavalin A-like superfamily)